MPDVTIEPVTRPFDATVTPPGSKSLTNRALVMAALADGVCDVRNALFADDTLVMLDGLGRLGFTLNIDRADRSVRVFGAGGRVPAGSAELFVGNSGTTVRFLTALCALGRGVYTLDGVARMRQRPIGPLVTMLRNLGGRVTHLMKDGYPPVRVTADGLAGGSVRFGAESSSQFLSAVLMAAPYARHEVQVLLGPGQTSWPYVQMTMQLMDAFGVTPEVERDPVTREPTKIVVPRGAYAATSYDVEPDASNASYFLALAAVHPGSRIEVRGLSERSLQGDAKFGRLLARMGATVTSVGESIAVVGPERLRGVDVDLADMPDCAQTLAVVSLFAEGPTTLRGISTLRVKETDRIAALEAELTKLGATVKVDGDDAMTITPPKGLRPAAIDTYDDHRMAMSFAVAATRVPGVVIRHAECVNKTYPEFFDDLRRALGSTSVPL